MTDIIARVDARYRRVGSLMVSFRQYLTSSSNSVPDVNVGVAYFSKPGRWRLSYVDSPRVLMVCDGTAIRITSALQPALLSTIPLPQSELHAAFRVFWDVDGVDSRFDAVLVDAPQYSQERYYMVRLVPRSVHAALASVTMLVDADTFLVAELTVDSTYGFQRRFEFALRTMAENLELAPALFVR